VRSRLDRIDGKEKGPPRLHKRVDASARCFAASYSTNRAAAEDRRSKINDKLGSIRCMIPGTRSGSSGWIILLLTLRGGNPFARGGSCRATECLPRVRRSCSPRRRRHSTASTISNAVLGYGQYERLATCPEISALHRFRLPSATRSREAGTAPLDVRPKLPQLFRDSRILLLPLAFPQN